MPEDHHEALVKSCPGARADGCASVLEHEYQTHDHPGPGGSGVLGRFPGPGGLVVAHIPAGGPPPGEYFNWSLKSN
jgi:hypothetical protein